jgi:hypothetical protein
LFKCLQWCSHWATTVKDNILYNTCYMLLLFNQFVFFSILIDDNRTLSRWSKTIAIIESDYLSSFRYNIIRLMNKHLVARRLWDYTRRLWDYTTSSISNLMGPIVNFIILHNGAGVVCVFHQHQVAFTIKRLSLYHI